MSDFAVKPSRTVNKIAVNKLSSAQWNKWMHDYSSTPNREFSHHIEATQSNEFLYLLRVMGGRSRFNRKNNFAFLHVSLIGLFAKDVLQKSNRRQRAVLVGPWCQRVSQPSFRKSAYLRIPRATFDRRGNFLDSQNRGLSYVPKGRFSTDLLRIEVSHNSLSTVENGTFSMASNSMTNAWS